MDYLHTYPELVPGRLVKRYQRFLADVELADGSLVTAHCPNPGRMTSCLKPGGQVWLSRSDRPDRRLRYTWELAEMPAGLVMVNPLKANAVARAALERGLIPELTGYDSLASEVKLGLHSRIDLRLGAACWVEVKSCTLVADGLAQFPDAPSARALRHLNELMAATQSGQRGVMLYLVGRGDAESFAPAAHIDPAYADGLKAASAAGVEVLAYSLEVSTAGLSLGRRLALAL